MAPRIDNLAEWAHHLLATLHRQVAITRSPELHDLLDEVSAYPGVAGSGGWRTRSAIPTVVVPLRLRVTDPGGVTRLQSWFSTNTSIGTPGDITARRAPRRALPPRRRDDRSDGAHGDRPADVTIRNRTLSRVATLDDVRPLALSLERSYEVFVRDRRKFRVGQIVYLAFSRDESIVGFAFPKDERAALVGGDPATFLLPAHSDLRFNWVLARLAALDPAEAREFVVDAWRMVVPKKLSRAYDATHPDGPA